jgi:hypothetical protein
LLPLPAGVLAVHQLRYLLAYGSHAGSRLSAQGDDYVASALVIVGLLVAMSLLAWLTRVVVASRRHDLPTSRPVPVWRSWLELAVVLLAGFCVLEVAEMVLEPQHPVGFAGLFGGGGWWAFPAAAALAALLTLFALGGRKLLAIVARPHRGRGRFASGPLLRFDATERSACLSALASCAAGRAPPRLALPAELRPAQRT